MKTADKKAEFIELRAKGLSYSKIAEQNKAKIEGAGSMELIDFTKKREAAGTAAKYERLTEQNIAKIEGYMAGLLASYDFQTLYKALSLQDKKTIDSYINSLTAQQTQRGALKNG